MNWLYLILFILGLFILFETIRHHILRKTLRFFIFLIFLIVSIFIISSYFSHTNSSNDLFQTGASIIEFVKKSIN